ncbi:hemerythrin domain-containing protein [Mycolicibacterium confluentis]|nr:hemerythrin domain-containing protein [Mycolicibacterium confluentis]MCV7319334.1 hemerythrin domain-containing protein [Mycolicibacterium confluentis]ORV25780.1 hemerythrin [Mycolicibacterium confluentis]
MCQYCGCRDIPLLRDYIAEHERVINCGGEAVRALDRGEYGQARSLLAEMAEELRSHWRGEEEGLFVVMAAADDLYGDYIAPLVREHRDLDALLESVDLSDPDDQARIRAAMDELYEHIAKEEDGLFPASLTALDGEQWDAAISGWQAAHPGQHLIGR